MASLAGLNHVTEEPKYFTVSLRGTLVPSENFTVCDSEEGWRSSSVFVKLSSMPYKLASCCTVCRKNSSWLCVRPNRRVSSAYSMSNMGLPTRENGIPKGSQNLDPNS